MGPEIVWTSVGKRADGLNAVVTDTTRYFSFDAPSDVTAIFKYAIDDGIFVLESGKKRSFAGEFSIGTHTFTVQAVDGVGNASPLLTYTFTVLAVDGSAPVLVPVMPTVDTAPPVTSVAPSSIPPRITNEKHLTIYGTVDDLNIKVDGTLYKLGVNGAEWPIMVPCTGCPDNTFAVILTDLQDGNYTLYLKSTDTEGNTEKWSEACSWVSSRIVLFDVAVRIPVRNLVRFKHFSHNINRQDVNLNQRSNLRVEHSLSPSFHVAACDSFGLRYVVCIAVRPTVRWGTNH